MLPLKDYIKNPRFLFTSILLKYGGWIPDKPYLQMMYFLKVGKQLNFDNPQTFNEKLQWLKLYNRKPEYTMMVDKYAVKDYVAGIIGKEHIIPTLGVWDKPEDIDFDSLPNQFVLKTTHGGGGNEIVICRDKTSFDHEAAIRKLRTSMSQNIYKGYREWVYKDVKHRIVAEELLSDPNGELNDYKVFVFNGEPKIIELDYNRFNGHQRQLYDFNWRKIEGVIGYPSDSKKTFSKPRVLGELYELAKKLSKGIPLIRTDFYIVNNHIYFGELTFYPDSGFGKIKPNEFGYQLGEWINCP